MTTAAKTSTTPRRRRPAPATSATPQAAKRPAAKVEVPKERPVEGYTVDLQAEGEDTDRKWENLLAKDPNENHREFQAWFEEATGESLDLKTIQYTLATWHEFQRSPEHKAKTQQRRAAAAKKRAEAEKAKVERARKLAEKAGLTVA